MAEVLGIMLTAAMAKGGFSSHFNHALVPAPDANCPLKLAQTVLQA